VLAGWGWWRTWGYFIPRRPALSKVEMARNTLRKRGRKGKKGNVRARRKRVEREK
jgi:hypothetical protein